MFEVDDYKPIRWLNKFNWKHKISHLFFINVINEVRVKDCAIYDCITYIFKILNDGLINNSKRGEILKDVIKIYELLNKEKVSNKELKFDEDIKKEILKNHIAFESITEKKNIDRNELLFNIHFNILIFTWLVDFILFMNSNEKNIDDFLLRLIQMLSDSSRLSNWIKATNSDFHVISEQFDGIEYEKCIDEIVFSHGEADTTDFFESIIVIRNYIKITIFLLFEDDFTEDLELINGCFDINVLENQSDVIFYKNENNIRDFNILQNLYGLIKLEGLKFYTILPFMTITTLPYFFMRVLFNKDMGLKKDVEHKKNFKNKYLIKFKITDAPIAYERSHYLKYNIGKNKLVVAYPDKVDQDYMLSFLDKYIVHLKNSIEKIDNKSIRDHLLNNIGNYKEDRIRINLDFQGEEFSKEIEDFFIDKDGLKSMINKDNQIIHTLYDEIELLFYVIPLFVSFFLSSGIEIEEFNGLLDNISDIVNHTLSFGNTLKFINDNPSAIFNAISDSLMETIEDKENDKLKVKEDYLNELVINN